MVLMTSATPIPAHLLSQIENAATWLCEADRSAFYAAVAAELAGHEIGPGLVARSIAKAFAHFYRPLQVSNPTTPTVGKSKLTAGKPILASGGL
jgi:hypothetical protein